MKYYNSCAWIEDMLKDADAMSLYAIMLRAGDGVNTDKKEAIRLFELAIDKSVVGAMFNYACMKMYGDGVPENRSEAIKYFKRKNL